ncbi:MAG TPA: hypothetical protein VKG20_09535 [Methylomirabilota bacterium]|nr:hypothetical protein [Methylomirabilota bacterium]
MQKLVEMARRALDVDQKAAAAGRRDNPKTLSASLDVTESEICAHFTALARERRESCEARLARLQLDRKATAAKIDVKQTRDSFARLLTPVEPGLEKLRSDHNAALYQAKENEARAHKHLRWFQQKHGLHYRAASYPTSQLYHFAIVAALALVEWVSLAAFYAEGSDFGLLGGVLIAMTLSIVNISLAILTGSLLRYVNHRSGRRKALALTGVALLTTCFLLVTLAAAHYRVATNDIVQAQAEGTAPGGASLPHVAADFDQWRAARLAWQRFARNPVGFDDVFSWILVVLAVIFGIFATYKGYRFDDAYPGYGELDRELGTRRTLYETKKAEYCRLVDQVFDRILDEQARLLADVKANIEYYQQLVGKSDDERRAFVHEAAEIQDACNILLKRYRQANARARTSPAPFYFNNGFAFEAALVRPPEAISEEDARLSRSYESAMKDFSDIARQNDATVQNLRTAEIRRRDYYFNKLERDIRERLIREAWEIKS